MLLPRIYAVARPSIATLIPGLEVVLSLLPGWPRRARVVGFLPLLILTLRLPCHHF